MGHFKTFLLGVFTAYGVYYITRKGDDGRSILDDLLADPGKVFRKATDYAVQDTVHAIREELR